MQTSLIYKCTLLHICKQLLSFCLKLYPRMNECPFRNSSASHQYPGSTSTPSPSYYSSATTPRSVKKGKTDLCRAAGNWNCMSLKPPGTNCIYKVEYAPRISKKSLKSLTIRLQQVVGMVGLWTQKPSCRVIVSSEVNIWSRLAQQK